MRALAVDEVELGRLRVVLNGGLAVDDGALEVELAALIIREALVVDAVAVPESGG